MTSGDVNELGFDESRLQRVTDTLTQQINSGYIHGAMMRVSRRGQIVVDFMDGYAEKASGRRLERDSVFVTMSVAKPFTSVLILSLVERGLLRLDRKSVVEGKSVSVRVDLGGRRIIKQEQAYMYTSLLL